MHSSILYLLFEIGYGFNPLTPLDLLPLPINEIASLDGKPKVNLVKQTHDKAQEQILHKSK